MMGWRTRVDGCPPLVRAPRLSWVLLAGLMVALDLLLVLTIREQWLGWMPSTTNAWAAASVTVPPSLLAGASAWLSGAPRRSDAVEWLSASPRVPNAASLWSIAWVASAGVVAHGVTFVVMALLSSQAAPVDWAGTGPSTATTVLLVAASTVLSAAWGGWLGAVLPSAVALPLAAAVPYALGVASAFLSFQSPLAALFVHNSVPIAARSSLSVLLVQSFLYVLLAAWLSLFIVQHGRRWGMGWVVSAVVAVAVFGGLPVVYPPGAEDPVCRGQQPAVCVPRSQLAALDDLALFSTGAVERLPSSLRPDFVLGSMPAPGPGSSVSIGSDKVVGRQQVTAMIGAEVFDPACATTEGDPAVSAGLLTWWWREQGLPEDEQIYPGGPVLAGEGAAVVEGDPGIRESVAARLTAMTDTQRRRWLAAKAEQIRTCSLTPADVT